MTNKELRELLEDLQDDAPVKIVKNGREYDTAFEIVNVDYYNLETEFIQIEMSDGGTRIE